MSRLGRWSPIELEWAAQGVEWRQERAEDDATVTRLMLIATAGGSPPAPETFTGGRALGTTRMPLFKPLPPPAKPRLLEP